MADHNSRLFTADPCYIPGCEGFCPQLHHQIGTTYGTATNRLLTDPAVMKTPHTILAPLRQTPTETTAVPPKRVRPMETEIPMPETYILPRYAGHRPMLQFQHSASFSRMAFNGVDDFLDVQSSVTRRQINRPVEWTAHHKSTEDPYTTRHWKQTAEYRSPLSAYVKTPKIELPQNLQRNAIPAGYSGFIPPYHYSTGTSYTQGVKASMDEFDCSQSQIRPPVTCPERRPKPTYWSKAKIYSPAGLLPNYTGFIPGYRDSFGSTYGNTTRQLYIKNTPEDDPGQGVMKVAL